MSEQQVNSTKLFNTIPLIGAAVCLVFASVDFNKAVASDVNNADTATTAIGALHQKVVEKRALIYDPAKSFNASRMVADLDLLASESQSDPAELRQILILKGTVEYKRHRVQEAYQALGQAFALNVPDAGGDQSEAAEDRISFASLASQLGRHDVAAKQYRIALDLSRNASKFKGGKRFALQQKYGYELNECGQFDTALKINLALLRDAERSGDPAALTAVMINIAQNLYDLKRPAEAETYLRRSLAIATKSGDINTQQSTLFQLGMLALEKGNGEEARRLMNDRIKLCTEHRELGNLNDAKADLAELERKLRASQQPGNDSGY